MSKNKKILLMLAKGGISQADVAAALHVSKRDVSTGAKAVREFGLTFDSVSEMEADAIDDLLFPKVIITRDLTHHSAFHWYSVPR